MTEKLLTGLKKVIAFCVENYKKLLKQAQLYISKLKQQLTDKNTKKKLTGFIALVIERWKTLALIVGGILVLYYGIGATVSSSINNPLNTEIKKTSSSTYTVKALSYSLKTQLDDTAWTPALPIIFPAAILDNLPNFQIGVKDGVHYYTKKLAIYYKNPQLKEATNLLDYPTNIWLFSQTDNEKFAPGSAKQYRKALAKMNEFSVELTSDENLIKEELDYLLKATDKLLETQIERLSKHVIEHNSEMLDFKADNIFYYTKGIIFTTYYVLTALTKDYHDLIIKTEQYEHLTSALKHLKDAEELSPISVQNGSPTESYTANHLLYLAYYLSETRNQLAKIRYSLKD